MNPNPPTLKRALTLSGLILYGIVLIQPTAPMPVYGAAAEAAHGHVVTAILIGMVAMLFTAISYGRMANAYPSAGSAYTYVTQEIHPALGYCVGWAMLFDYVMNPIICAIWCSKAAMNFLPAIPYPVFAVFFPLLFTLLNLRGIETSTRINAIITACLSLMILLFFGMAIHYLWQHPPQKMGGWTKPFYDPTTFSFAAVSNGAALAVLTYIGFDGVSTLSEEAHNPRRNILLATVLVCLITGILSSIQVYIAQLVWPEPGFPDTDTAFCYVGRRAGGPWLFQTVNLALLVATVGSGMGAQLGAGRLLYGMGRDNALPPKFFAAVSPRTFIPSNNIILVGVLTLAGAFSVTYALGAELLNFGALAAFMGVNIACFVHYYLRAEHKKLGNFLPPLLGFAICLYLWISLGWKAKKAGLIWLAVGLVYGAWRTRGFRKPSIRAALVLGCSVLGLGFTASGAEPSLESGWVNPPPEARLRAYWWWLNGNVTGQAITRDLEEMKAKGFGGAVIMDADGSSQEGNARAPHGPTFFSPEWRALYKHALHEADRLGLEMSLNIQSGWNLGGPMVKPEDAPKKLVWSEARVTGGSNLLVTLPQPKARDGFYRDLCVLAYPINSNLPALRKPLQNLQQKALLRALEPFSAPVSTPLFEEYPSLAGEEDTRVQDVTELTAKTSPDGTMRWDAPAGQWQLLRFGYTLNDHCRVSTCSQGWDGYAIDPFDAGAFQRYWAAVVEPLIADAGPLAGKALKYLHTDSWEVEVANWTSTLREEFKVRRGYDLLPWLPVFAGKIVNSRNESNRFLEDFRRTMGDLAIGNHYKLFREGAHRYGLLIHPESGGPHAVPIDAQQCLGFDDAPMSEFWAWSWRHRIGDENRFFVKQPASAAHTYGHKLVLAEGFTTIGPHWQERLWDNLKPSFDHACTEGLNLLVWHAFVCSPASEGVPGQQYFAGTHLNPNVTWWEKSAPFFSYINRCQWLLQQGLPVADVLYYYGEHVPNFTQLRKSDPARVGAGYDYDVVTAEVLLQRINVKEGRLVLPEGTSYRLLVLPERKAISLPVLRRTKELVLAGATVLGPRPERASGLTDFPNSDDELKRLTDQLWWKNLIHMGQTAREVLLTEGIKPDFEWNCDSAAKPEIDFIHRRTEQAEIYFVANRSTNAASVTCTFRNAGKAPEMWDPLSGERHFAGAYSSNEGRTTLPLELGPCGSMFVVFQESASQHLARSKSNSASFSILADVSGPWTVDFDPKRGGPKSIELPNLVDWTMRPEPGIKFYSGTAMYRKTFELPQSATTKSLWLDLGVVRELAEVKVNGLSCGVVWTPPFRVNITRALRSGANQLEIGVVNFWPNRIIGDQSLPESQRMTHTNIRKLTRDTPLMSSGLVGPVRVMAMGE